MENKEWNSQQQEILLFEDYYDHQVEWWNGDASNFTVIPVGQCKGKNYDLTFDEEYKGNYPSSHAIITGMLGTGKSSLLHTLIVGSCIKYSPNELRLILVDMKSNEFKQYDVEELPHADIIANHATPEVGCHILQTISEMINERMDFFIDKRVSNYYNFRNRFPNEELPRYLIIVDEYAPLIQDSYLRRDVLYLLNNIIVHGRKFGFNLILSSQTLNLPVEMLCEDTWGREPNRIVMRSNAAVARSILGFGDDRVPQLEVGQAIIDADTTDLVQLYYLPTGDVNKDVVIDAPTKTHKSQIDYLKMIRERWNERTKRRYEHHIIVFDREKPALLSNNRTYNAMTYNPDTINKELLFSPGEKYMADGTDFMCKLGREKLENIIVVGGKIRVSTRTANTTFLSMLPQLDTSSTQIDIVSYQNQSDTELFDIIGRSSAQVCKKFPKAVFHELLQDISSVLDNIIEDIEQRKENAAKGTIFPPRFLVIYRTEANSQFTQEQVDTYLGRKYAYSEQTNKIKQILLEGPQVGVFSLLHFSDVDGFFSMFDDTDRSFFSHRILLQMSEDDSKLFLDSYIRKDAADLVDHEASEENRYNIVLYKNVFDNSDPIKIKPYEFMDIK